MVHIGWLLGVSGDFGYFWLFFGVFSHICCSYLSYMLSHLYHICHTFNATSKSSHATNNFFTQFLFTPGGNFGPNPDNPAGHLVVENGDCRKKNFDTNIEIFL